MIPSSSKISQVVWAVTCNHEKTNRQFPIFYKRTWKSWIHKHSNLTLGIQFTLKKLYYQSCKITYTDHIQWMAHLNCKVTNKSIRNTFQAFKQAFSYFQIMFIKWFKMYINIKCFSSSNSVSNPKGPKLLIQIRHDTKPVQAISYPQKATSHKIHSNTCTIIPPSSWSFKLLHSKRILH